MVSKVIYPFAINSTKTDIVISEYTDFGYISNGKEYLDAGLGNCGSFLLGFKRTDIVDAVTEKCRQLPFISGEYFTTSSDVQKLSELLYEHSNGFRSIYSLSGSDAIETAVKVANMYHRVTGNLERKMILGISESYHGSTYLTSSIAGGSFMTADLGRSDITVRVDWSENDDQLLSNISAAIANTDGSKISSLVIESCSWRSGLTSHTKSFWKALQILCHQHDILLIIDDIAMGGGKTGKIINLPITPDIFCLGKSISGGYFPLSITMVSDRCYKEIESHFLAHGFTYSFSVSGIYSALSYFDIIKHENILDNYSAIKTTANQVFSMLISKGLIEKYVSHGLYYSLIYKGQLFKIDIEQHFRKYGLHIGIDNYLSNSLRVIIPLTADSEYFESLSYRLSSALSSIY